MLELTPDLVGPSITKNSGIIGEGVDLNLEHLGDMRPSHGALPPDQRICSTPSGAIPAKSRSCISSASSSASPSNGSTAISICKGGTYPAQLMYQELADMACERITAAITATLVGERPIKAVLDPYNPTGSTTHVNFNTSKTDRWQTDARRCHINWVILDSDWEAEFCRVAEVASARPRLRQEPQPRASKCPTATARRRASTCPTSSCWWTMATARTTCCI